MAKHWQVHGIPFLIRAVILSSSKAFRPALARIEFLLANKYRELLHLDKMIGTLN